METAIASGIKELIDIERLPKHIAIIMDGNGRWAKQRGRLRVFGHQHGVKAVRESAEAAAELGVEFLTLYSFSTENWNRPKSEIDALMNLLVKTIGNELKTLQKNDIRLATIGDIHSLPKSCQENLKKAMDETKNNKRMTLTLALSYSAKWDLMRGIREIANEVKTGRLNVDDINEDLVNRHLTTSNLPHPELLIRTSGEQRISNFLLWEIAYSELYFTPVLWPDFKKEDLFQAIIEYQRRERRFGKTSEQL